MRAEGKRRSFIGCCGLGVKGDIFLHVCPEESLLPAEERTLLVYIGSHVAGQLDDGGEGGCFHF